MYPINTVNNKSFRKIVSTLEKKTKQKWDLTNCFSKVSLPAMCPKCQGDIDVTAVEYFATTTDLKKNNEPLHELHNSL